MASQTAVGLRALYSGKCLVAEVPRAAAVPGVPSVPLLSSLLPEIFHAAATSQTVGQLASSLLGCVTVIS